MTTDTDMVKCERCGGAKVNCYCLESVTESKAMGTVRMHFSGPHERCPYCSAALHPEMDKSIPEEYRSKTIEQALAHLAEELNEAATAAAKSIRFGPTSVSPELSPAEQESNIVWLRREMTDVVRAYDALDKLVAEHGHLDRGEMIQDLRLREFNYKSQDQRAWETLQATVHANTEENS